MLMRFGPELAAQHDLSSLQAIFCAGEPLNPEAWRFLFESVGRRSAAVCNQWWQTETGAIMMGFLPSTPIRPDRSGKALGPIDFDVVAPNGERVPRGSGGLLVIRNPWPHMFAGVWGDAARYRAVFRADSGLLYGGRRRYDRRRGLHHGPGASGRRPQRRRAPDRDRRRRERPCFPPVLRGSGGHRQTRPYQGRSHKGLRRFTPGARPK